MDINRKQLWDERTGTYFADGCEYAGEAWIAPVGSPVEPDGATPGICWISLGPAVVATPN